MTTPNSQTLRDRRRDIADDLETFLCTAAARACDCKYDFHDSCIRHLYKLRTELHKANAKLAELELLIAEEEAAENEGGAA